MILRDDTVSLLSPGRIYFSQLDIHGPSSATLTIMTALGGYIVRKETVDSIEAANAICRAEGSPELPTGGR